MQKCGWRAEFMGSGKLRLKMERVAQNTGGAETVDIHLQPENTEQCKAQAKLGFLSLGGEVKGKKKKDWKVPTL